MNKSRDSDLTEPTKLMRRLKIIASYSTESKESAGRRTSLSGSACSGVTNRGGRSQNNVNIPLPPVTNGRSITQNSGIKKNNQDKNKNNSNVLGKNNDYVNKFSKRSFSTLGRFLSTPYGNKSQDFMNELSQGILSNKIKRIVIMAGAGISCPSGIPDFRSPGSGLYDNLQKYKIPFPEAIFDIDYFMTNPKPFFTLAKDLFPSGKYRPNKVHYFFKLLQQKKLLLRVYTQNIDGLERLAGITDSHLVEAHGTFASATCVRCGELYSGEYVKTNMDIQNISRCSKCKGIVKPDIVFFGEDLPSRFHLHSTDFRQADLLIVMGTSLEVEPFASIVDSARFGVPRLLLNRQAVGVFRSKRRMNDYCLLGDIVDSIETLVKVLQWETDLENVIVKGEKEKISFLDTISNVTTASSNHSFNNPSNIRRTRPAMLPPVSVISKLKRNQIYEESSIESCESSTESDSSSS